MEKLRRAIRERRRVQMTYRGRGQGEARQRVLNPYALVHRWGWWYTIGYCHLRAAVRSFRVDRISELILLDETFDAPASFDIRSYLATDIRFQPGVRLRLRFVPQFAQVALDDRPQWETVEPQSDGAVIVSLGVPDMAWAASTVLAYGPIVEVSDCLKMLYEIGYLKPELVAPYAGDFLKLLRSRKNRLVWGAMIALSTVAGLVADESYPHVAEIQRAITEGSVITVDAGVLTLARLAKTGAARQAALLPGILHVADVLSRYPFVHANPRFRELVAALTAQAIASRRSGRAARKVRTASARNRSGSLYSPVAVTTANSCRKPGERVVSGIILTSCGIEQHRPSATIVPRPARATKRRQKLDECNRAASSARLLPEISLSG